MESKKISFGFMKTKKVDKPVAEEKKDFIECVEEKNIKVVGGEEAKEVAPLVIPMKPNTLVTAERLKEIAEKVESALEEPDPEEKPQTTEKLHENETLEQMAVRELMADAKKDAKVADQTMTVLMPAKTVANVQKESTLEDYESVPVQEFGLAMLRGMGWTPGNEKSKYKQPELRPKGLGLGADKVIKNKQKQKSKDGKEEELSIVKNAYVKITSGKHSGYYGKVVSLDEDNGRVMVDITVKKETISLSEFMMHPVTKSEFDKECKVINANSYDEYKKKENSQGQSSNSEKNSHSSKGDNGNFSNDRSRNTDRDRHRTNEERNKYQDDRRERDDKRDREERRDDKRDREEKRDDKRDREERRDDKRDREEKRDDKRDREEKRDDKRDREEKRDDKRDREDRRDDKWDREEKDRDRSKRETQRSEDRYRKKPDKRYSSNESLNSVDSERKYKKKDAKRYSSNDSLSSDTEQRRYKKKDRRRDSSSSDSDRKSKKTEGKRDIDKKRKGKKKKRDRDRSPNYRKHRK